MRQQRRIRLWSTCGVAALALLLGRGEAFGGQVVSTFDSGDEGWTWASFEYPDTNKAIITSSGNAVTWHSTGGNPGGFIGVSPDPNGDTTMFAAPSTFLGNQTGMASLSYDFFDNYPAGGLYNAVEVALIGTNGTTLVYEDDSIEPNGGNWVHVGLNFAPSSDWYVTSIGGTAASASDFSGVLGSLQGLYIRTEFYIGPGDDMGLDNVALSTNAVPEPSSIAMGLTSGGALALLGWKRRRRNRRLANDRPAA